MSNCCYGLTETSAVNINCERCYFTDPCGAGCGCGYDCRCCEPLVTSCGSYTSWDCGRDTTCGCGDDTAKRTVHAAWTSERCRGC